MWKTKNRKPEIELINSGANAIKAISWANQYFNPLRQTNVRSNKNQTVPLLWHFDVASILFIFLCLCDWKRDVGHLQVRQNEQRRNVFRFLRKGSVK